MALSFHSFQNIAKNSPAEKNRPSKYLYNHASRFYETYKLADDLTQNFDSVLSIGAGRAFVEYVLAKEKKCKVTVFDFKEAIERNYDQYNEYDFQTLIGNFLEDSDLINQKYDLILFCEIIEHIPVPPAEQFEVLTKFLKPKGHLIVSTPNIASTNSILKLLSNKNIIATPEKLFSPVSAQNEHVHRREYVMSEIVQALSQTGLKNCFADYIFMRPPRFGFFSLLQHLFLKIISRFRPMMLFAAQKNKTH